MRCFIPVTFQFLQHREVFAAFNGGTSSHAFHAQCARLFSKSKSLCFCANKTFVHHSTNLWLSPVPTSSQFHFHVPTSAISDSHLLLSRPGHLFTSINQLAILRHYAISARNNYCSSSMSGGGSGKQEPEAGHQDKQKQMKNVEEQKQQKDEDASSTKKAPSLMQRFKKMYKEYWYILVPVHLVTSAFWFGSFYYAAKSGVDVVHILESIGASEVIIKPLRNSEAGYVAVAYALYKLFTPARYAVTLGGTTISIKYLRDWGYIKPVPTGQEFKRMYDEKREEMKDMQAQAIVKAKEFGDNLKDRAQQGRDKALAIREDFRHRAWKSRERARLLREKIKDRTVHKSYFQRWRQQLRKRKPPNGNGRKRKED